MLFNEVEALIGSVPYGLEPIVYIFCCMFLLWLCSTTFSILWSVISWIGGK